MLPALPHRTYLQKHYVTSVVFDTALLTASQRLLPSNLFQAPLKGDHGFVADQEIYTLGCSSGLDFSESPIPNLPSRSPLFQIYRSRFQKESRSCFKKEARRERCRPRRERRKVHGALSPVPFKRGRPFVHWRLEVQTAKELPRDNILARLRQSSNRQRL